MSRGIDPFPAKTRPTKCIIGVLLAEEKAVAPERRT